MGATESLRHVVEEALDLGSEPCLGVARGDGVEVLGPCLLAELDPVALDAMSLSAQVVVGQLRVATVDLLEGLGIEHDRARNTLPELV